MDHLWSPRDSTVSHLPFSDSQVLTSTLARSKLMWTHVGHKSCMNTTPGSLYNITSPKCGLRDEPQWLKLAFEKEPLTVWPLRQQSSHCTFGFRLSVWFTEKHTFVWLPPVYLCNAFTLGCAHGNKGCENKILVTVQNWQMQHNAMHVSILTSGELMGRYIGTLRACWRRV